MIPTSEGKSTISILFGYFISEKSILFLIFNYNFCFLYIGSLTIYNLIFFTNILYFVF